MKERRITAPVLSVSIDDELERIKQEPEWTTGAENGIALVKYPHLRVVLVALKKGKTMRRQDVQGPLSVYVISGSVIVKAGREEHEVQGKGLLTLRRLTLHEIHASSDSVLLLTLVRLNT